MYLVTVMFSAQSSTVPSNIASTGESRRTLSTLPLGFRRCPSPPSPTSTPSSAPPRPTSRTSCARASSELVLDLPDDHPVKRVRRGEDGAARPARPRVVEGRGRRPRARAPVPAGASCRAPRRPTRRSRRGNEPDWILGPRDRGNERDRPGDRAAARPRRRHARGARLHAQRHGRGGGGGDDSRGRRRAGARARERRVPDRRRGAGGARARTASSSTTRRPASIRPALETEDKHWDWTLNANARALLAIARATAPAMEPGSSILAISSLGSQRVLDNYILVGTSKAALESVIRYLAVELGPLGIRVNAVSGGVVETDALEFFPNEDEMLRDRRADAGRPAVGAGRHRRGRVVPGLPGRGDGARADADRRRRLLAARVMEPTDFNRRMFDDVHRTARTRPGCRRSCAGRSAT